MGTGAAWLLMLLLFVVGVLGAEESVARVVLWPPEIGPHSSFRALMDASVWEEVGILRAEINGRPVEIVDKAAFCLAGQAGKFGPAVVVSATKMAEAAISVRCYPVGVDPGVLKLEFVGDEGEFVLSQNITINSERTARELWSYGVPDEILLGAVYSSVEEEGNFFRAFPTLSAASGSPNEDAKSDFCGQLLRAFHPGTSMLGGCDLVMAKVSMLQQQALARKGAIKEEITRVLVSKLSTQCQQRTERMRGDCLQFLAEAMPYAVDNKVFDHYYTEYVNRAAGLFLLAGAAANAGFFALEGEPGSASVEFEYLNGAEVILEPLCSGSRENAEDVESAGGLQDSGDGERLESPFQKESDTQVGEALGEGAQSFFHSVQRVPVLLSASLLRSWGAAMTTNTNEYLEVIQKILRGLSSRSGIDVGWKLSAEALGAATTASRAAEMASLVGIDDFIFVSEFEAISKDDLLSSRVKVVPLESGEDAAGDGGEISRPAAFGSLSGKQYQAALAWLEHAARSPPFLSPVSVDPEQYNGVLVVIVLLIYCGIGVLLKYLFGRMKALEGFGKDFRAIQ